MASARGLPKYEGNEINYQLAPGDELVQCPYDKVHKILKARLPFHLVKCRANYKKAVASKGQKVDMAICKWNSGHHFPRMEIGYHEESCSDAGRIVEHVIKLNDPKGFVVNAVVNTCDEQLDSSENWDNEAGQGQIGYNPKLKLEKEAGRIIQSVPGVSTRSERRDFRAKQTELFNQRGDFYEAPFHCASEDKKSEY